GGGAIRQGQVVGPADTGTRARVARDIWSIPWDLRHEPESPGTDGGPRGPSDTGPNRPGQLIDLAGPWPRTRVTWDRWSTLRALGPERNSPGRASRDRGHWNPGQVARDIWWIPRALGHGPGRPD
ncbi:hypothetical protein C0215_19750, partial [Clostridioides difficile]